MSSLENAEVVRYEISKLEKYVIENVLRMEEVKRTNKLIYLLELLEIVLTHQYEDANEKQRDESFIRSLIDNIDI